MKLKNVLIKFFSNIICFFKYNISKEIVSNNKLIDQELNNILIKQIELENKILMLRIMNYYFKHPEQSEIFKNELSYLENQSNPTVFPYKNIKKLDNIISGYDNQLCLSYVIHNNKKLYFSKLYSEQNAVNTYKYLVEIENILGGNFSEKSPHQYESEKFCLNEGDYLIDVGCAEGLFALNSIDKVKKLILVESDECWIEALEATFSPYKNKVKIINKLVSDIDSDNSIKLTSIQFEDSSNPIFIKMDIEGYETSVIKSISEYLSNKSNITLSCCTYHKHNDAEELLNIFKSINYNTEFSDGYMIFIYDIEAMAPPFFRKGILRAKNNNT